MLQRDPRSLKHPLHISPGVALHSGTARQPPMPAACGGPRKKLRPEDSRRGSGRTGCGRPGPAGSQQFQGQGLASGVSTGAPGSPDVGLGAPCTILAIHPGGLTVMLTHPCLQTARGPGISCGQRQAPSCVDQKPVSAPWGISAQLGPGEGRTTQPSFSGRQEESSETALQFLLDIYLRDRASEQAREHKQGGGAEGKREADSLLSREPNVGFCPRTLES